jgi:hypothetical protein
MGHVLRQWRVRAVLVVAGCVAAASAVTAQTPPMEQLRREFEAMKKQMREMQEIIRKQQGTIDKLTAEKSAPAAAPKAPSGPTVADEERIKKQVTEQVMRNLQPSLTAANKTFPSQFNPAIGLILDNAFSYKEHERGNFEFRAAEVGISANVDPFVRGYAILTGSPDGFNVEEAAIVTTSLPYNLTLKGGRFFADFGRLSKFHDHDLPFVNRPLALDNFVQGESQADGVEASVLVPIPQYLTLTAGAYNKLGAGNDRADNTKSRDFSKFTYLGRAATFFTLNDANSVDLGTSYAYTPEVEMDNGAERHLAGVDLTYRYTPLSQAGYRGFIWGTEALYNQEDRPVGGFPTAASTALLGATPLGFGGRGTGPAPVLAAATDPMAPLVFKRRDAVGLYSYVEARLTRRFYPGFLFDYAQDIDHVAGDTLAYSPYLTVWLSEFQRLRLQYTRLEEPGNRENQFFLQWTVILGSHVHGFRDR